MKKNLFILAAAALVFAACSNDEVVESVATSDSNAISFRPFSTNLTRAADEHFNQADDQFGVTAFHQGTTSGAANIYFDNILFKTTDGSTFTSQSNKYYWPSDYNLDFYAYAPLADEVDNGNDDNDGALVTRSAFNTFLVRPGTDVSKQPDFVYGVTKNWGKKKENETYVAPEGHKIGSDATGVAINFRHAESKVVIKLKNTNDNLKITVGAVTIRNLRGSGTYTWNGVTDGTTPTDAATANTDGPYTTGTLNYLNGAWSSLADPVTAYTITTGTDSYDDDDDNQTDNVTRNIFDGTSAVDRNLTSTVLDHEMILIPQALTIKTTYDTSDENGNENLNEFLGACITVQIKIQNKASGDYIVGASDTWVTAMWPLTALTWNPGFKYTYIVDLANGGYYTTDQDLDDGALDPILEGAEIKFVTVTVDDWKDADPTSITAPTGL